MSTVTSKVLRLILPMAGMAIAGLIVFVLFIWMSLGDSSIKKRPFEKEVWMNGTNESQMLFPRQGMADHLIAEETLRGMGKKEVLEMLGKPAFDNIRWSDNETFALVYKLGPERGFMSVDSEWLAIQFGKDEKVTHYGIITD